MSIKVGCISCGKIYQVDDRFAGKKAKCKTCGAVLEVPIPGKSTAKVTAGAPMRNSSGAPRVASAQAGAKPVQRVVKPVVAAVEPAGGEYDFSGIDDVENSGT